MSKFTLGVLFIVLLASLSCAASDKEWAEVRSQHFRVITDGTEKDARRVAREFEQIRFAMSSVYPKLRLDSGAPLLVLCPRDEASMKSLAPQFWKRKGFKPAGLFQHGWDKEYALVRLDEIRPESYEVVYHEYVHSVMHLNIRWLRCGSMRDWRTSMPIRGSKNQRSMLEPPVGGSASCGPGLPSRSAPFSA